MRAVLAVDGGPAFTRSGPERRFLRLVRESGLAPPRANFFDGTYELDFLFQRERLVVEVDTFAYHSDPRAFERDRLRDAELEAQGYSVMRVTDRQLDANPHGVITRLRQALATRQAARTGS